MQSPSNHPAWDRSDVRADGWIIGKHTKTQDIMCGWWFGNDLTIENLRLMRPISSNMVYTFICCLHLHDVDGNAVQIVCFYDVIFIFDNILIKLLPIVHVESNN